MLHTVCAHKIRFYKQALLSLLGNLSWLLELVLPADEKNSTYQLRIKPIQLRANHKTGKHCGQGTVRHLYYPSLLLMIDVSEASPSETFVFSGSLSERLHHPTLCPLWEFKAENTKVRQMGFPHRISCSK